MENTNLSRMSAELIKDLGAHLRKTKLFEEFLENLVTLAIEDEELIEEFKGLDLNSNEIDLKKFKSKVEDNVDNILAEVCSNLRSKTKLTKVFDDVYSGEPTYTDTVGHTFRFGAMPANVKC